MDFHQATLADTAVLARMNQWLIRDEGHRNPMSLAQLEERMRGWLSGQYQAFIFGEAGEPYGYVLYRREAEWVYISQLWVDARFRRRGVGRAAISWMIENHWTKTPRLRMEVLVHNVRGLAFWRAIGFADYALTLEREL